MYYICLLPSVCHPQAGAPGCITNLDVMEGPVFCIPEAGQRLRTEIKMTGHHRGLSHAAQQVAFTIHLIHPRGTIRACYCQRWHSGGADAGGVATGAEADWEAGRALHTDHMINWYKSVTLCWMFGVLLKKQTNKNRDGNKTRGWLGSHHMLGCD